MSCYIQCPNCNNKIIIEFFENSEKIRFTCPNCNTHIIMGMRTIKKLQKKAGKLKSLNANVSGGVKVTDEVYGQENNKSDNHSTGVMGVLEKSYNAGKKMYDKLNEEYNNAINRLYKQGIDEWDEEKLKNRARYAGFFEEIIIRQRLREKREQNSSDDE